MSYWDRFETNPIHAMEREESRAALYAMTEMDRVRGCTHTFYGRTCTHCGHTLDKDEL